MWLLSSSKTADTKLTPSIELLPGGKTARLTYETRSWDVTLTKPGDPSSLSLENLNAITDLFRKVVSENNELSKSLMQSHREGKPFVFNKSTEASPQSLWERLLGRDLEYSVWTAGQQDKDQTPINQPIQDCLERLVSPTWFQAQIDIAEHLDPIGLGNDDRNNHIVHVGNWEMEEDKSDLLDEELGSGLQGVVYKHTIQGSDNCARKLSKVSVVGQENALKEYAFLKEIQKDTISRGLITFHPQSDKLYYRRNQTDPEVFDYFYDLTLCQGTLDKRRQTSGDINLMLMDVLYGLKYIHDKGFCHGDIKSGNILMKQKSSKDAENSFVLSDFGSLSPREVEVACTAEYKAPEQQTQASFPADIFALGVTVFESFEKILNAEQAKETTEKDTKDLSILSNLKSGQSLLDNPGYNKILELGETQFRSNPAWQLMKQMLDRDPQKRPTVDQAISRLQGKQPV
jgi:hypothetical protein